MSFSIVFVCTGNVCRSPAAERLLAMSAEGQDIEVSSVGTAALVGEPVSPPMAELLQEHGASTDGFEAQQMTAPAIRNADVVITMTAAHRTAVVRLVPAAVQRTFVLGELAQMVRQVDDDALLRKAGPGATPAQQLAAAFTLAKHHRVPGGDNGGDIEDPYGRSKQVYARSFDQILDGLGPLTRLTRPI